MGARILTDQNQPSITPEEERARLSGYPALDRAVEEKRARLSRHPKIVRAFTYVRGQWNPLSSYAKVAIIVGVFFFLVLGPVYFILAFIEGIIQGFRMLGALWAVFFLALYFVPAIVAYKRHHRQTLAITVLNVAAGWTGLGWVAALVWACTGDVVKEVSSVELPIDKSTDRLM